MKMKHTGKYLLSASALGLCFFAYTQAVAKTDFAMPTVVQPLSNLAESQQPVSLLVEAQGRSVESMVRTPTHMAPSNQVSEAIADNTIELAALPTESVVSTSVPVVMSEEIPEATADNTLELAQQPASIPPQFQGEWSANLERCGAIAGESRLWIGANYIEFYESGGPVLDVVTQGDVGLTVTTELSGEGDTWQDQRSFQLSPDYQALETSSGFVRYRCP